MELTLAILLGIAVILLVFSFINIKKQSIMEQKEIDNIYFQMMKEIEELQKQIRQLELESEIIGQEVFGNTKSAEERALLRDILDLFKRGYSIQGIAAEKKLDESKVEELLAPFKTDKKERGTAENEQ